MSIELISSTSDTVTVTMSKTDLLMLEGYVDNVRTDSRYGRKANDTDGYADKPLFSAHSEKYVGFAAEYSKTLNDLYEQVS
jgi:hypothetical protein